MAAASSKFSSTPRDSNSPRHTSPTSFLNGPKYNLSSKFHPLIFLLFLVLSASFHPVQAQSNDCITVFDANKDYFPDKVSFKSSDINITYSNSYKTIEYDGKKLVLYQCGAPKPVVATAKIFSVPVGKVAIMDTTSVTYLEVLNERSNIAYAAYPELISSACVQEELSSKNSSMQTVNSLNQTVSTQQLDGVGLVLSYLDPASSNLSNQVEFAATSKGVQGRIDHLSLLAAFFNQESLANTITTGIRDSYSCLSTASLKSTSNPVVAWTTFNAASDFNNNTASWSISFATYKTDLVHDAGGKNLEGNSTQMFATSQDFKAAVKNVDIIIDETFASLTESDFRKNYQFTDTTTDGDYKFLKNKMVFQANKKANSAGGSPWFESAILFDHVVLADLISFINPSLLKDYTTTYFRNVFSTSGSVLISASDCVNVNEALTVPVIGCPVAVTTSTGNGVGKVGAGFFEVFVGLVVALMC